MSINNALAKEKLASHPSSRNSSKWLTLLVLLAATGALLGVSTNLAKLALKSGLDALAFLAWSVFGAAVVLLTISAVRGRLPTVNARTAEYFAVAGLFSVAMPNLLFFAALPRIGWLCRACHCLSATVHLPGCTCVGAGTLPGPAHFRRCIRAWGCNLACRAQTVESGITPRKISPYKHHW